MMVVVAVVDEWSLPTILGRLAVRHSHMVGELVRYVLIDSKFCIVDKE